MNTYTAPALNAKTTKPDQDKLITALKRVRGVETATLHLEKSQFEIKARLKETPKPDEITAAAKTAGFPASNNGSTPKK